jgi:hypothetical protein
MRQADAGCGLHETVSCIGRGLALCVEGGDGEEG